MVESGLGVTILPRLCRWKCNHDVRFVPLADQRASRTVGWIARANRSLQPASRMLLDEIASLARECQKEFGYVAV
jgi:LysR family transcriptional regulator, carnitine catabolism transcriptional activator